MDTLLAENLLPALNVSVVKIGAHVPSVEFCVIICILVMIGVMKGHICKHIHCVHSLQYHQQEGFDEVRDQDYEVQPVSLHYPPTEDTTSSHGKHPIYDTD